MKARGAMFFTLVELLVVIAVIAVLASLLLPALAKAKGMASALVCKNKLKQLGVNMSFYLNDNNGVFPDYNFGNGNAAGMTWCRVIGPLYYGFKPVNWQEWPAKEHGLVCPDAPRLNEVFTASYGGSTGWVTSYGMNTKLGYKQVMQMRLPGSTYAFVDAKSTYLAYRPWYPDKLSYRHSKRCNILFVDTHVDQAGQDDMQDSSWEP